MSDVLKPLSNIRSLRVIAREYSLEQLESALEKLQFVVEEKRQAEQEERQLQEKRLADLEKYKSLLAEDGLSVEELAAYLGQSSSSVERKKNAPRPAKYKFVDQFGVEKTWTGQGRTPSVIQAALDAGKKLEDFAI